MRRAALTLLAGLAVLGAGGAQAGNPAFKNMGLMRACLTTVEYAHQLGAVSADPAKSAERFERARLLDGEVEMFEAAAGAVASAAMADSATGLTAHRRTAAACAAHGDCAPAAREAADAFALSLKAACLTDYRSAS